MVGTRIAGYTIRKEVGEGGTSSVYLAEHPNHGTIAVKVLREKLRQDKTAVARFIREAKYGARVKHPNVVETIEIGQAENGMYDPETKRVKLLDFGIATDTQASSDERLTRAGFFVGTLMYIAPEALSGEIVTAAADQYSLATIAYFLLTRCLPYTAKAPREMFTQLLTMPPIPLKDAGEGVFNFSPALDTVVMRALSRMPAARYPSVMAFADAFTAAASVSPEQPKMLD